MNRAITLIGMAGAGKSTVGVVLAKRLVRPFIDTDLVIQERIGSSLQTVIDRDGYLALRDIEQTVLLELDPGDAVIATGGSAVYSDQAMAHLQRGSVLVYLELALPDVLKRIGDYSGRGIAKPAHQTIEETFAERCGLYKRWADITIDATLPVEAEVEMIHERLNAGKRPKAAFSRGKTRGVK